jgi:thioredoxin 1
MPETVQIIEQPVVSPGRNAAKLGIIAAVTAIALNLAGVTILEGQSAARTMAAFAALAAVWGGVLAAGAGLFRAWRGGSKDVMILAAVGLLLNGGLLAMGLGKLPVRGRPDAVTENLSTKTPEAQSVSSQSSRRIVTKDWTAGFILELTDNNFEREVESSRIPVLVDFWASWCGPCRMMSPIIGDVAQIYAGKVKVCKVNVDSVEETTARFKIRGIPTIILFEGGKVRKKWVGVTDKSAICLEINKLL